MKSMIETPHEALRKIYRNTIEIQTMRSVAGRDINEAYLVALSDGTYVFMKKKVAEDRNYALFIRVGLKYLEVNNLI